MVASHCRRRACPSSSSGPITSERRSMRSRKAWVLAGTTWPRSPLAVSSSMSMLTWIMRALLRSRTVHGVALVEAGAEHEQAAELVVEDRVGGAQGGGDRDRPALRQHFQERRGGAVLDTGAGETSNARILALRV